MGLIKDLFMVLTISAIVAFGTIHFFFPEKSIFQVERMSISTMLHTEGNSSGAIAYACRMHKEAHGVVECLFSIQERNPNKSDGDSFVLEQYRSNPQGSVRKEKIML